MRIRIEAVSGREERAWEVFMPWDSKYDGKILFEKDGILNFFHVEDMEDGESRYFTLAVTMMNFT